MRVCVHVYICVCGGEGKRGITVKKGLAGYLCVLCDSLFHCTNFCNTSTGDSGGVLPKDGGEERREGEEGRGGGS